MREYLHSDVLKIFPKIRPRTLISWSEAGLVTPMKKPHGPGTRRVYSYVNLLQIAFIRECHDFYLPFKLIRHIMDAVGFEELVRRGEFNKIVMLSVSPMYHVRKNRRILAGHVMHPGVFNRKEFRFGEGFSSGHFIDLQTLKETVDLGLGE